MCDFGLMKLQVAPKAVGVMVMKSIPIPLQVLDDASRAPMTPERRDKVSPEQETLDRNRSRGSPDFGGGVDYHEDDGHYRGHIPEGDRDSARHREHILENNRPSPPRHHQSRTPPEGP